MLNEKEFTTAQRADDTRPSLEEARLLGLGEDELADCRNQFEKTTIEQIPGLVPVFEQAETAARAITLLAAQRKITWGEYASRLSAAHSAYKILAAAAVQQYEGQLTAQHQAELQNRRAAAAILLQYGLQLQELDNQRRAIDSTNRPVFTNCTAGGPMTVNCVSH